MSTVASCLTTLVFLQPRAIFAHGFYFSPVETLLLFLIYLGPFILAGILLFAAVLVCFWHKKTATAICASVAVLSLLLGWYIYWEDQRPVRERHARWAAKIAEDPNVLIAGAGDASGEEDFKLLQKTTRLRHLDLGDCDVTGKQLAYLDGLNHLEILGLGGVSLKDSDLQHVGGLTQLRELDLRGACGITDAGLRHLKPLTHLEKLDLSCCFQLTGEGLENLKGLTSLKTLTFRDCGRLTDAGMRNLRGLASLEELDISGCRSLTDAAVEHLEYFPSLKTLRVGGTGISHSRLEKFRHTHPNCEISG